MKNLELNKSNEYRVYMVEKRGGTNGISGLTAPLQCVCIYIPHTSVKV